MRLRILLTKDEADKLLQLAVRQRRPLDLQAEMLLRHALGLPIDPAPDPNQQPETERAAESESAA